MRAKAAARMLSGIPVEVRIVFATFQVYIIKAFFFNFKKSTGILREFKNKIIRLEDLSHLFETFWPRC